MPGLSAHARSSRSADRLRRHPSWRLQEHRRRPSVARDQQRSQPDHGLLGGPRPPEAADRLCEHRAVRSLQEQGRRGSLVACRVYDSRGSTSSLLDPRDPKMILAFGPGPRGVRSTNAGRTWQPAGAGLAAKRVSVLAISGERAYAATSRGVFSSADGGKRWAPLPSPGTNYVQALAIAPDDPDVVYAGSGGTMTRGLYKSTDGGHSWQRLTVARREPGRLCGRDRPRSSPQTVYIGTGESGLFKSTDGGANWHRTSAGLAADQDQGNYRHRRGHMDHADGGRDRCRGRSSDTRRPSTRPPPEAASSGARTPAKAGIRSTPV